MNNSGKSKTRIRRKNNGMKKLLFFAILLFITVFVFIKFIIPGISTFSRYVYSAVRSFYLNSKEFYFNSDKLSSSVATFESSNWSGVGEYEVPINMNSRKNINEHSKTDIIYNIEYEYEVCKASGGNYPSNSIDFYLKDANKQVIDLSNTPIERTIFMSSNYTDIFFFSVVPNGTVAFKNKDFILVKIKAKSTKPYVSELIGEFKIIIGNQDVNYKIEDEAYSPYAEVIITNEFDYYVSKTSSENRITIEEYLALSDTEKENYYSKKIELSFDPTEVVLDTTSSTYIEALLNSDTTDLGYTTITKMVPDGSGGEVAETYDYINYISFYIDAEESKVVKFYKVDASRDYTYDSDDDYLVVNVTYT